MARWDYISPQERLEQKCIPEPNSGCWLWEASDNGEAGYGVMYYEGRLQAAHRVSYQIFKGDIPEGFQIDHLCKVRLCVNPDHLEAVTPAENNRRSPKPKPTHCPHGHEYTEDNILRYSIGHLRCRKCDRRRKLLSTR